MACFVLNLIQFNSIYMIFTINIVLQHWDTNVCVISYMIHMHKLTKAKARLMQLRGQVKHSSTYK